MNFAFAALMGTRDLYHAFLLRLVGCFSYQRVDDDAECTLGYLFRSFGLGEILEDFGGSPRTWDFAVVDSAAAVLEDFSSG